MEKHDAVFGETALRKGYITYGQLKECRDIQQKLRDMGLEPKPLKEILAEKNYLSDAQATAVFTEVSAQASLDPAAPAAPPSSKFATDAKPASDYPLAELALKEGLITFDQMRECLDTQQQIRNLGYDPKSLDQIMLQKGILNETQIEALKAGGTRLLKIPPRIDSRIGDVGVQKKFISKAQLDECLQLQARDRDRGQQPKKVGELLVAKGYLTIQQLDELVLISSKTAAPFEIPGYEILGKLGVGGMGAVYKAKQVSIDRVVAIKVLYPKFVKDREYLERFLREARLLAKLQHPNIVAAIDAGEVHGTPYFVMEFVDGLSLSTLLDHKGRIPETDCIKLGIHIANALQHAHRHKLVHRDIKPQNVIITRDGLVKVCDLGIAKSSDGPGDAGLTTHGMAVGTPFYMSPEACMGRDVDIRADIYSLGATLYHLSTGTPPFDAPAPASILAMHVNQPLDSPQARFGSLSSEFAGCVIKMMHKHPTNRFQTPADVARHFESLLKAKQRIVDGVPVRDTGQLRVRRPARTSRSVGDANLPPTATILMVLVFVIAGIFAAVYFLREPAGSRPSTIGRGGGSDRPPPDTSTPAPEPVQPEPPAPKADLYRPLHESRIAELRLLRSAAKPNPTVDEFLEPYDFMIACLALFKSTPHHKAWLDEIAAFEREANERASDLWDQVRLKVEGRVELGETHTALELLEGFPPFRRYAGRNLLTEAERERTKLLAKLQSQAGMTFEKYSAKIEQAAAQGNFASAWRDALEVSLSAGRDKTL
ncbi:MAG TPA: protein kinase, partial [Planctomycetota bacterium]|nr:protein kinase [Planctomycetota bacterium]